MALVTIAAAYGAGGSVVAPLVGAAGTDSAVPMAAIMVSVALAALVARRVASRAPRRRPV
jgi:hypothetical protein